MGILILTFGIALTIVAGLGTSPYDALLVGLYNSFGLTIGSWEYILGFILVIVNAAIQRKRPDLLAMVTAIITGLGIDLWIFFLKYYWKISIFGCKVVLFLFGIIFIGLGVAMYLQAEFAPSPMDSSMLVIQNILGVRIAVAKNILMLIFLLFAFIFEGPINLGTLVMFDMLRRWVMLCQRKPRQGFK
ncbi:MAG: YitT family protein [Clostridia bacterium]|nr:YitT family protein [Clostridia bacterium]MDD4048801.1 YitT family protein [Clostridia bacterium]